MKTLLRRWHQLLGVVALFVAMATNAGDLPLGNPADVGIDAERLARITSHFQSRVDAGEIAGIVTLVARRGKIVHHEAIGYQDVARSVPMRTDTMFRIYSMTKPIASTALMMLREEARFRLTDPVVKYIPEFEALQVLRSPDSTLDDIVPLERQPTVQDVMRHTAGFSHFLGTTEYDRHAVDMGIFRPENSLKKMMTLLAGIPLIHQPGEHYRYSVGPDIALRLVEILSDLSAEEFLQQRIFQPLGMVDTGYVVQRKDVQRFAPVHWSREGKLVPLDDEYGTPGGGVLNQTWSINMYEGEHAFKGGSFGLVSTAADYWRFAQAMLNGGELDGKRILGPRTVAIMSRDSLSDKQRATRIAGSGFGLGFGTINDEGVFGGLYQDGSIYWSGAAATSFWIDPAEELVVVAMTQHRAVPLALEARWELAALVHASLVD
ncbi:MAG: serine hydrolase [Pseudomonadales bacterium]|nr:serine hydrolase [Pseudomonadales bacterium]